ncbi:MAG: hypothetical protein IVW51_19310 [Thermaceae bacterium]|nr:hypothetical protein [Thermaceae bacterium]
MRNAIDFLSGLINEVQEGFIAITIVGGVLATVANIPFVGQAIAGAALAYLAAAAAFLGAVWLEAEALLHMYSWQLNIWANQDWRNAAEVNGYNLLIDVEVLAASAAIFTVAVGLGLLGGVTAATPLAALAADASALAVMTATAVVFVGSTVLVLNTWIQEDQALFPS